MTSDAQPARRRVLAAALTVAMFGLAPKLALVAKDLLLGWRFGTAAELDALLIALLAPVTVTSMLGGAFPLALDRKSVV